jgi:hypothetical protein
MDRQTAPFVSPPLTLPDMQASPDAYAPRRQGGNEFKSAPDGIGRAVEEREYAVAGVLDPTSIVINGGAVANLAGRPTGIVVDYLLKTDV